MQRRSLNHGFAVLMEAIPPFYSYYTTKSRGGQGVAKQITPKACISSATCCGISSMRSIVSHQAAGGCTLTRDDMHRTSRGDDMPSLRLG